MTMTLIEAINRADNLTVNGYSQSEKIAWLSELDGRIKESVIDKHEGGEAVEWVGYNDDTPLDTELLIPKPYDSAYIDWIISKIEYANGEIVRYNNYITRFNDVYGQFVGEYHRTHMPKGKKIRYF